MGTAQADPGAPTANAGGPYSGDEGAEITFSGDANDLEDAPNLLTYESGTSNSTAPSTSPTQGST